MFKVMTLNMFRYHDWEARYPHIVSLIQREQPDVVVMQEVLTNHAFSDFPQSDQVADDCGFKYRSFAPTLLRTNSRDRNGERNQQASEGQACISKYPIVSSENYFLRQYADYPEDVSVQFCTIEINGTLVDLCNVHFANNHIAYQHVDELLDVINKRSATPIILGDFNIYKLAEYKDKNASLQNYVLSSEIEDYISFPDDGDSLDYIIAPLAKYQIQNVACPDVYVSDHKALLADISCK